VAAADRIKTRIMRLLRALLPEDGGQDGASDDNRVRKKRFHLIGQRWHVEKMCRESTGTIIPGFRTWNNLLDETRRGGTVAAPTIVHLTVCEKSLRRSRGTDRASHFDHRGSAFDDPWREAPQSAIARIALERTKGACNET
jgi:hypothetical protein